MKKNGFLVGTTLFSGFLLATGCSFINAPSEVIPIGGEGGAGGGSSSSTSSTSSSSSSSSTTSSSSSGMGGSGGGSMVCQPGAQLPCYDGTPGTAGQGECKTGLVTCLGDGMGYGACEGQVVNTQMDVCGTPLLDENCDGIANDGCPPEHLAIIFAAPPAYADEVRTILMGTGAFELIDNYDASIATPTLADLQGHQSVLVFSDKVFIDPVTLGNVLADYYDGGGRVVLAQFATVGSGTRVQGRFGDASMGYMLLDPGGALSNAADDKLGKVVEPQSRLMQGVSAFSYMSSLKSTGGIINGGSVVAQWDSGFPLIVRGKVQNRNRVDINFYPPKTQMALTAWLGDGAVILRNALLF